MSIVKYDNIWRLLNEYDFEFDVEIDADLQCSICKKIMRNACNNLCCCKFCFECIQKYLHGEEKYCPNLLDDCKEQMINIDRDIQINHFLNKKISKLTVKCPMHNCDFKNELCKIEDHIKTHKMKCFYFEMGCFNSELDSNTMQEHLIRENDTHTRLMMESFQNLINELAALKEDTKRKEMKIFEIQNKVEGLINTNAMLNEEIVKLNEKINKYERENQKRNTEFLKTKDLLEVAKLNLHVNEVGANDKLSDLDRKADNIHAILEEVIKLYGRKMNGNFEVQILKGSKKDSISDDDKMAKMKFASNLLETCQIQKYLPFRWIVDKFKQRQQDCKYEIIDSIKSEPVYTNKNGYKLRLVIYPNGVGSGTNTHLSVGFHIMKGEFDDILSWPMKHKVTVSVNYYLMDYPFLSMTYDYQSQKDKSRFMKPTNEMNPPIGKPKFIKFEDLYKNQHIYQDDKVIFRCSVELI